MQVGVWTKRRTDVDTMKVRASEESMKVRTKARWSYSIYAIQDKTGTRTESERFQGSMEFWESGNQDRNTVRFKMRRSG